MEYLTKYPKNLKFTDGNHGNIAIDSKAEVETLFLVVRNSIDEIKRIFIKEGMTTVKFEHVLPSQIGHGWSLKMKKPWEMHVRLFDLKKGMVAIQAEVEVSRDYLQHLFSQRTPVIYEIEHLLKKHQMDYQIWNNKIKKYVHTVFDNYKIMLKTPSIPVFAWKPMLFVIATVGSIYLWKYINTI